VEGIFFAYNRYLHIGIESFKKLDLFLKSAEDIPRMGAIRLKGTDSKKEFTKKDPTITLKSAKARNLFSSVSPLIILIRIKEVENSKNK
jgi:hypothetical protein